MRRGGMIELVHRELISWVGTDAITADLFYII